MATLYTPLVRKVNRQRGVYGGKIQPVTGELFVADGTSIATTDIIHAIPMGENTRPVRLTLQFVPTSGTVTLTNAVFDIGVAPLESVNFKRPNGDEFAPLSTSATVLSADLTLDSDKMASDIEVAPPSALANYGPYVITITPTGAGAFSTSGGDGLLKLTVEFVGEQAVNGFVYEEYMNSKVNTVYP